MDNLKFDYDPAIQRSPEWLARKRGKIGASRMGDWLAVSKAKTGAGKPLKARLDYEKELMFERQFGVSFNVWVSEAMQEGIDFEDFARKQFITLHPEFQAAEAGCWFNEFLAVSPDRILLPNSCGLVYIENQAQMTDALAGLEIKIVKDNTFTEILMSGVPDKHMKQIQSGLWATGLKKWYYVALNFNTKRFIVLEVERDEELIAYMAESIQEKLVVEPFALTEVHDIVGDLPDWSAPTNQPVDGKTNNGGDWS